MSSIVSPASPGKLYVNDPQLLESSLHTGLNLVVIGGRTWAVRDLYPVPPERPNCVHLEQIHRDNVEAALVRYVILKRTDGQWQEVLDVQGRPSHVAVPENSELSGDELRRARAEYVHELFKNHETYVG